MTPHKNSMASNALRVVAWETTKRCAMRCSHCRAEASGNAQDGELSEEEGFKLIDGIAAFAKPLLILTGGEPMSRPDIYKLAAYAASKGLNPVMAPCGPLVDAASVAKMKDAGISAISISVDGADAATHDALRNVPGAFETALKAIRFAVDGSLRVQVNCAVSKLNASQLEAVHALAEKAGASALDFFFLVPTGRGTGMKGLALDATESRRALEMVYEIAMASAMPVKTTCAPQYARLQRERDGETFQQLPPRLRGRGCLGGKGFAFISHDGIVQPCGFLKVSCGDLRKSLFDVKSIYEGSPQLKSLRDAKSYAGSCGSCEFAESCGGCRARAFELSGDFLAEDPDCAFKGGISSE